MIIKLLLVTFAKTLIELVKLPSIKPSCERELDYTNKDTCLNISSKRHKE